MLFKNSQMAVAVAASGALANYVAPVSVADVAAPVLSRSLLDLDANSKTDSLSAVVNLDTDLTGPLVDGVSAAADVLEEASAAADVGLSVICTECFTKGNINASVSLQDVIPALSLSLTDIEAYLDLDVSLPATTIAVNLFSPTDIISLNLLNILDVDAMIYLDLVLGVEEAIDFTGGIYVKLVDEAILETNILSGEILKAGFSGLGVKLLPIEVTVGCTTLQADLRLRVQLGAKAGLDIDLLGLDLDLGAGVELGVFANLVDYNADLCDTAGCYVSEDSWDLNVGAGVGLDVDVGDILSLNLAPTISTALLSAPTQTLCEHGSRPAPSYPAGTATVTLSSYPASQPASYPVTTPAPSGMVTSTVYSTTEYTITSCAASVPNCPASYQSEQTVTKTIDSYTTVCPATMSLSTFSAKPTVTKTSISTVPSVVTVTTDVTTLVPCSSVGTFTPPSGVPTVPAKTTGTAGATGGYPTATVATITQATTLTHVSSYQSTSTIYSTSVQTVTSCAATVTNCPAGSTGVVTATVAVTTTVCPVEETHTSVISPSGTTVITYTPVPGWPSQATSSYPGTPMVSSSPAPITGTSSAPYPYWPTGGYPGSSIVTSKVWANSTVCPETMTSSVSKPSASATYTSPAASSTPSTPLTAGGGKAGSSIAGFLAVVAAFAALL